MCGNGGDAEQAERQVASSARVMQKGGRGWDGVRTGSSALRPFPWTLLPAYEITEEPRQCLGFGMNVAHDSQVPLEQMNIFPAWPVSRNRQKDKENVWTRPCLSSPATRHIYHPFYSEAVGQRSGLCVRGPGGEEIL